MMSRRRAYSLMELVVSLAILSIIMVTIGSAVVLATRALPDDDRATAAALRTSHALDQLVEEIETALHFTTRGVHAVGFTVPDRNNDGIPERLSYTWSGVESASLLRSYNGSPPVSVLDDITEFELVYVTEDEHEVLPGPFAESAESLMSSYVVPSSRDEHQLDDKEPIAQLLQPSLSADATSWRLSRVTLEAEKQGGSGSTATLELRTVDAGDMPTDTVIDTQTFLESDLPGGRTWVSIYFNDPGRPRDKAVSLVLVNYGGGEAGKWLLDQSGGTGLARSTDSGATWTSIANQSLLYEAWGHTTGTQPDFTVTRTYVRMVDLALQSGDDGTARHKTTVRTRNRPEVLAGLWETDFSLDPVTSDLNGDGVPDWAGRTVDDTGIWSDGTFTIAGVFDATPTMDAGGLVTVEASVKDTISGGFDAVVSMTVDPEASTVGTVFTSLQREGGKQILELHAKTGPSTSTVLKTIHDLSPSFIAQRIVIDPVTNSLALDVDGTRIGSYTYPHYVPAIEEPAFTLQGAGGTAVFDGVSYRVGEP